MNLINLSIATIRFRPLSALLTVVLTSFGVALISFLITFGNQLDITLNKNLKGIDLVVGAKGSPLQLILANVYHIDNPTGNIKLAAANRLAKNPQVKQAVKLAYGDYYQNHRIVGTGTNFISFYGLQLSNGKLWQTPMEVVIGSNLTQSGLRIGDEFTGNHGDGKGERHGAKFKVVGILASSGTVVDGLVLTSIESIWSVHQAEHHVDTNERELTAMLIRFKSAMGMMTMPRMINQSTNMQAALPSIEVNRLLDLLGFGIDTIKAIAFILLFAACFSIFLILLQSLSDRKYELALMRVLGASASKLFLLILLEALMLALTGAVIGFALSKLGIVCVKVWLQSGFTTGMPGFVFLVEELYLLLIVLLLALLSAIWPAYSAYRTPVVQTILKN